MDSVSKKDLTEEDIKTRYITPALNRAGWPCDRLFMEKSVKLTDGRILVQGRKCSRQAAKRVDDLRERFLAAPNRKAAMFGLFRSGLHNQEDFL